MVKTNKTNVVLKNYTNLGVIAAVVIAIALIGIWGIANSFNKNASSSQTNAPEVQEVQEVQEVKEVKEPAKAVKEEVKEKTVYVDTIKIAVINMDKIQSDAAALKNLHRQRANFEEKLKARLASDQESIEKEKAAIEKSQDVLSQEALQRRVTEYQRRVTAFQKTLSENAKAIDDSYQDALKKIQDDYLDPVINNMISKKKLSLVIDGRMARVNKNSKNLDITDEVIKALNDKVSSVKMATPKGF